MRRFAVQTQPPLSAVDLGPLTKNWNADFPSRFGMRWEGGLWPNQPIPSALIADSTPTGHGAPLWPTPQRNRRMYLFSGGTMSIGPGPDQIVQFKQATDAMRPAAGLGPGTAYQAPNFHGGGFGMVDT